mgnify:CR=1 FL=1
MLDFKEYRRKNDAYYVYENNTFQNQLDAEINKAVDDWIKDLQITLMEPLMSVNGIAKEKSLQRSLWDRFSNTIANLWHGRYQRTNPYYYRNIASDYLGSKKESYLGLEDYKNLKETVDSLENLLVEQKFSDLRLFRVLQNKGEELKVKLKQIFAKYPNMIYAFSKQAGFWYILEFKFKETAKGEFLWNAKPRFGKTLASYDLVKQLNANKVLIVN